MRRLGRAENTVTPGRSTERSSRQGRLNPATLLLAGLVCALVLAGVTIGTGTWRQLPTKGISEAVRTAGGRDVVPDKWHELQRPLQQWAQVGKVERAIPFLKRSSADPFAPDVLVAQRHLEQAASLGGGRGSGSDEGSGVAIDAPAAGDPGAESEWVGTTAGAQPGVGTDAAIPVSVSSTSPDSPVVDGLAVATAPPGASGASSGPAPDAVAAPTESASSADEERPNVPIPTPAESQTARDEDIRERGEASRDVQEAQAHTAGTTPTATCPTVGELAALQSGVAGGAGGAEGDSAGGGLPDTAATKGSGTAASRPAVDDGVPKATSGARPERAASPAPKPEPPAMYLTGVISAGDAFAFAIVRTPRGSMIVRPGDEVDGTVVKSVGRKSIIVTKEGEEFVLELGGGDER